MLKIIKAKALLLALDKADEDRSFYQLPRIGDGTDNGYLLSLLNAPVADDDYPFPCLQPIEDLDTPPIKDANFNLRALASPPSST